MAIPPQQAEQIKQQLLAQIEKQPIQDKEKVKEYIKSLNEEQLEEFLKQNKIDISGQPETSGQPGQPETSGQPPQTQCIFCSITKGETPSYKIAENKKSMAILEINPLSKGHSIVIPLEHLPIEKIPKSAMTLAQKIAKKIKTKLKPEDIKIETSSFQDHAVINIIPMYKDTPLKKEKAEESELKKLQSKLETKKRASRISEPKPTPINNLKEIGFRIPR